MPSPLKRTRPGFLYKLKKTQALKVGQSPRTAADALVRLLAQVEVNRVAAPPACGAGCQPAADCQSAPPSLQRKLPSPDKNAGAIFILSSSLVPKIKPFINHPGNNRP
jgi:hypothetical protein